MGTGMFLDINCGSLPEVCLGQIKYYIILLLLLPLVVDMFYANFKTNYLKMYNIQLAHILNNLFY